MDTQNEMPNKPSIEPLINSKEGIWHKNRLLIKSLLVGALTLLMLIPASFIQQLIYEREQRKSEVVQEVSNKWAQSQTVTGPILKIPYWEYNTNTDKNVVRVKKSAYFLPDQLNIKGSMQPQIRHRSIYDVTLYNSDIKLEGSFLPIDVASLSIPAEQMIWTEAEVFMGISDLHGLEEDVQLKWNDTSYLLDAGLAETDILQKGLNKKIELNPAIVAHFEIQLRLKGSENLYFSPLGKSTKANIKSPWKHPSFEGKFIPSTAAAINTKGFDATWNILQISSGIPKSWKDKKIDLSQSDFGIKLLQPNDGYGKTERSVKYALLFIGLTFTLFFFIEIVQKKQIHPVQYLLVGFALTIFYTLLLSITEYSGFNLAYAVSASATILLIGLYVMGIFKKVKITLVFAGVLSALYAYIFVLIQLQDFALLFGSIGLFLILAIIMFYSRKIDWYGTQKQA